MTTTYRAVAFDIDGTLYPEYSLRALSMAWPMVRHPRLFSAYRKVRMALRNNNYTGSLRVEQAKRVAALLQTSPQEAERRIETQLYQPWDKAYKRIKPFDGVYEALQWLAERGVPLGALSDFPVSHKLETLGVGQFFPVRLSSEDTGYLKPHAVPFWALAKAMQLQPEEILYVGNSYTKDIEGAANVGMGTVLIGKVPKNTTVTPTLVVKNYKDFIQQLALLLDEVG